MPLDVKLYFSVIADCRGNNLYHHAFRQFYEIILVIIDEGKHTFPSRTRSLSPQSLMVVQPRCCVRVSCCQSCDPYLLNGRCGSFLFTFSYLLFNHILLLMGNLKKKRRLKMNKHKRRKRTRANRHKKRDW